MDDNCMGVPSSARVCLRDLMGYISFPRGYCSAECTSDGECGTGGECVMFFGMGSYCLKRCSSPAECRTAEGYECTTLPMGSTTYCLPEFSPGADDGSSVDY